MRASLRSILRWPAAALLVAAGAVHIPLISDHLEEAPYMGVLFILFVVACFGLAAWLLARPARLVWFLSAALGVAALVMFVVTRTVGLPQLDDDIGAWTEPLAVPALTIEAVLVVVTLVALRVGARSSHEHRKEQMA